MLGNAFDVNFGFSGMAKLAAELRASHGPSRLGRRFGSEPGSRTRCAGWWSACSGSTRRPTRRGPLYADFLAEAAALAPAMDLAGAAERFRESGRAWAAITEAARAAELTDDRVALFGALAGHVETAAEAEAAGVVLMG